MTIPYTVLNPTARKRRETIAKKKLISFADLDFIINPRINGVCCADRRSMVIYKRDI